MTLMGTQSGPGPRDVLCQHILIAAPAPGRLMPMTLCCTEVTSAVGALRRSHPSREFDDVSGVLRHGGLRAARL